MIVVVFAVGFAGYRVGHKPPTREHVGGPVLVAKQLIPKGTPASIVATDGNVCSNHASHERRDWVGIGG